MSFSNFAFRRTATGVALWFAATAAAAVEPAKHAAPERASAAVSLADLDLSKPEDLNTAELRLAAIAQKLCRQWSDDRKSDSWESYVQCSNDTLAAALHGLESNRRFSSNSRGPRER